MVTFDLVSNPGQTATIHVQDGFSFDYKLKKIEIVKPECTLCAELYDGVCKSLHGVLQAEFTDVI